MPSWSDGEGHCTCPSGAEAGLGDYHREGARGCLHGPEQYIGKTDEECRAIAFANFVAESGIMVTTLVRAAFIAGWEAGS